ncbi:uncharacterized protein [Diadema antillarum]|uniref:uncharacterized protein n=1 Tax=Diadema antillarum TaxID=105358 RepID=UPI003A894A38
MSSVSGLSRAFMFFCLIWVISQTQGLPKEISEGGGDGRLSDSDTDLVLALRDKIQDLEASLEEITRSFATLELISKNHAIFGDISFLDYRADENVKRTRRGVDSSVPTSNPPDTHQSKDLNFQGPFVWPLFSGQCFMCPAGVPGPQGPSGPAGVAGRDGRDGRDAQLGSFGLRCGDETPEPLHGTPEPLHGTPEPVEEPGKTLPAGNQTKGVLYVRWGKPVCPQGAELIYSGSVGGGWFHEEGSGSNYLCLPEEPIYDEVEPKLHDHRARIYSAEYETDTFVGHWQQLNDLTPSCAVCLAPPGQTTKLMIPARNVCPSDEWRLEYAGLLMADYYNYKTTEYICVDGDAEAVPGSEGNQNGALLYPVETRCLSGTGLPCGPYINGYELTCAVCTI